MKRSERTALWATVLVTAVGLLAFAVAVAGELGELNRTLAALTSPSADPDAFRQPTPTTLGLLAASSQGTDIAVEVTELCVLSDTVALTVTVQAYGAGDLLFEPPILTDGSQTLLITTDSLEGARWAFLDLVMEGTATAPLHFTGAPQITETLWLVFNPSQDPGDVLAPPVSVELQLEH